MKKIIKRALLVLLVVFLLGAAIWRATPRSLESLTRLDFDQAKSFQAFTRATEFENGSPVSVSHKMDYDDAVSGTEHFAPMLELFKNIEARPSLSNLFRPWLISGFSWTGPVDFLYGGVSCGSEGAMFEMTDRGELMVGRRMYYITDEEQFNALWDYVTTHGTENRS